MDNVPAARVFTAEACSPASAASVYGLLADAPSWSRWAGPLVTYAAWETPPGQDGVTPVRRLGRRPFLVREEIVVAEEPFCHAYRLLSGQPVRSYEAEVRLTEDAASSGTRIVWTRAGDAACPRRGAGHRATLRSDGRGVRSPSGVIRGC